MEQFDLFGNIIENDFTSKIKVGLNKINNGEFIFEPSFFDIDESKLFLENLKHKILWKQESMNMYGKQINFPRLTAWYGENDKPYSFSGIKLNPNPWSNELIAIKSELGILCDSEGQILRNTSCEVQSDELFINHFRQFFNYSYKDIESQRIQETIFKNNDNKEKIECNTYEETYDC
jgi:hypothetical protein